MTENKITSLKKAGQVAVAAHLAVSKSINPGVNLLELEEIAATTINQHGLKPAFKGYKGYPAVTCLSVNEEIVHGIPVDRLLEDGDLISVDLGVSCNGWIVDTARSYVVGKADPKLNKLVETAQAALDKAVNVAKIGYKTGDIGAAVQKEVEKNGFAVVEELTGHGVGQTLQESPTIYNYGRPGTGKALIEGMVLAIEPIITLEKTEIAVAEDGWTVVSQNGTIGSHAEDTILVTADEPLILTR